MRTYTGTQHATLRTMIHLAQCASLQALLPHSVLSPLAFAPSVSFVVLVEVPSDALLPLPLPLSDIRRTSALSGIDT